MFNISLDASDVIDKLGEMEKKLKDFPKEMGEELTTWQTDDMRRRYPNIDVTDTYVETDIWPTSRLAQQPDKKKQAQIVRAKKQGKPVTVRPKGSGQRPILREELYEKLVKRMDDLLNRCLSWR